MRARWSISQSDLLRTASRKVNVLLLILILPSCTPLPSPSPIPAALPPFAPPPARPPFAFCLAVCFIAETQRTLGTQNTLNALLALTMPSPLVGAGSK